MLSGYGICAWVKAIRIRKYIHTTLLLLAFCAAWLPGFSQVKFYTLVSEATVATRQTFQVQYIVEGAMNIRQFQVPAFKGFEVKDVFDLPNSAAQGKGVNSYSKIIVLLALKKGRFTVPGARAVINGKPMHSNTQLVVVQPAIVPGMSHIDPDDLDVEQESILHPGDKIGDKIDKDFFLRVETSKNTCYVGEPLMVVYKAYSRLNANSQVMKRPSLTGFSVMEMVDAYDTRPELEKLNGRLYYTNLIRKVQLFPLQEGRYTLDPAEIESVIRFVKTNEPADKKGLPKGTIDKNPTPLLPIAFNYRTVLRTQPQTITVKPLPTAHQPADFSGAVGRFLLTVRVPSAPVHRGDLVKIQVSISGSGNISLLTPPVIKWPNGVDTAEPLVKENINKYVFPLTGTKTFEYVFAAPDTGNYVIPAIHLPYYDPAEKKYKTASSDSVVLHVLPGVKKKGELNRLAELVSDSSTASRKLYFLGIIAFIILIAIVYQFVHLARAKRMKAAKTASPKTEETEVPQKTAIDMLAQAKLALQNGNRLVFYRELQQALWNVMTTKYQVLPSQLNKYHIAALLTKKGLPAATIQAFLSVLDECEWALYTPEQNTNSMHALDARAEEVLQQLLDA